jgi:PPOX class probable F420-dependent enzyme
MPVCFAYRDGVLYVALDAKPKRVPVRELRRVRNLVANPAVQLLVDVWDEDWTRLAYLQLRGVASVIERGAEQATAVRLLRARYAQYETMPIDDAAVIRIEVTSYVAWGAV